MKVSELWRKLAQIHAGGPDDDIGGGLPTWFQSGSGSPIGSVTPIQQGALYQDTTDGQVYEAGGVTNADWQGPLLKPGEPLTQEVGDDGGIRYRSPYNVPIFVFTADNDDVQEFRVWPDFIEFFMADSKSLQISPRTDGIHLFTQQADFLVRNDGALKLTHGTILYDATTTPSNGVGADGNWALTADGHIFFKTGGVWQQKV